MHAKMSVCHFNDTDSVPQRIKSSAHDLLSRTILEGSVDLPCSSYDTADSWTLAIEDRDRVVGFAAHRYIPTPVATYVQVMGTFLDPSLRGHSVVSVINGAAPLQAFRNAPRLPVYLCTRTRNPAAYAAAVRFFEVYPKLDPALNAPYGRFADGVARMVYGPQIEFDRENFRMRGSYPANARFLDHSANKGASGIRTFFKSAIDYSRNEAIFMMSRVSWKHQIALYFQMVKARAAA